MATTADSLTSSGRQLAVDPTAIAIATASERRVIAAAVVASSAVAVAFANKDGHLCDGHIVDNCLHNGHNNEIVDKVEGEGTTMEQVPMSTIVTSSAKSSLCEYFEGVNWPLNNALPRGAEFMSGLLGNIVG
jgi:hypothetical protein